MNRAIEIGRQFAHEARQVWADARTWPIGAGLVVLLCSTLAATINQSTSAASAAGTGIVGAVVGLTPELLAMGAWALGALATSWVVGAVVGFFAASFVPRGLAQAIVGSMVLSRRERRQIGRQARRLIAGGLMAVPGGLFVWFMGGHDTFGAVVWVALLVVAIAATAAQRSRARLVRYVLARLATPSATAALSPRDYGWKAGKSRWDGRTLRELEVWHPSDIASSEPSVRDKVERAAVWALRQRGEYAVEWVPGATAILIRETPGEVAIPDLFVDRVWPRGIPGTVLGIVARIDADAVVEWGDDYPGEVTPVAAYPWDGEKHLLVIGETGGGKTVLLRGLVVRSLLDDSVEIWFVIDGKRGFDYASLEGRQGIIRIGYDPAAWVEILRTVNEQIMRARYEEARAYQSGAGPKPRRWPRVGLLIDEVQAVRKALGYKVFDPLIDETVRLIRAARGTVLIGTQRPDVSEALPGSVRDNLANRVVCGWMSRKGAEMALDADWQWVTPPGDPDAPKPPAIRGRAVARINGHLYRLQIPYLPSPVDEPWAESLYPPRIQAAPTKPPAPAPHPAAPAPPATPVPPVPTPPVAGPPPLQVTFHTATAPVGVGSPDAPTDPTPTAVDTPTDRAARILASLATAGPDGRRRPELDAVAQTDPNDTRAELAALIDAGHVVRTGTGAGTRYTLAWHTRAADRSNQPTDESGHDGQPPVRRRGKRTE